MKIIKIVNNPWLGRLVIAKFTPEVAEFVDDNRLDWVVFDSLIEFDSISMFDNWKEPLEIFMEYFDYIGIPLQAKNILLGVLE